MSKTGSKSNGGIQSGHAGEYFVMGELLRRGWDAQLADRNTRGYDILVGKDTDTALRKLQVKAVRTGAWFINVADFDGERAKQVTVYVVLGPKDTSNPVKYFIARNSAVKIHIKRPRSFRKVGQIVQKSLADYENRWDLISG